MEAGSAGLKRGASGLGAPRRRWGEDAVKVVLFLAALLSVATTVGIVASLIEEALSFFHEIATPERGGVSIWEYLTGDRWEPLARNQFGVAPLILGTVMTTAIALAVAVPLGLGSAVYISEYATARVRRAVKPVLELLAGIPTIVFGYFALTYFTPVVLRDLLGVNVEFTNALSAGIVMGFLVLPTIASVAEDAMSAVPAGLREGAFGLGASRFQVSMRVVFPAALSGIAAAVVLGLSRAIGETVLVLLASGAQPSTSLDPREGHATMTAFMADTARGETAPGEIGYQAIFAVGATLFLITLAVNALSILFVRRFRQVYE